ncbi:MAG TPA: hypothetical protein VF980_02970 [Thermoanaerobaculia bacterium]
MKRWLLVAGCCWSLVACRTAHVSGPAIEPLPAAADPLTALYARADAFPGARSIMSVRTTTGGQTRSFKAQLVVENRQRMELIVYTPVGTTAATIHGQGDRVTISDNLTGSMLEGSASDMLRQYGFFTGGLTPAEMGMLLLGYPPRRELVYQATAAGLARAEAGDVVVTFNRPSLPAQHALVAHGADTVEIEHLEVAAMQ